MSKKKAAAVVSYNMSVTGPMRDGFDPKHVQSLTVDTDARTVTVVAKKPRSSKSASYVLPFCAGMVIDAANNSVSWPSNDSIEFIADVVDQAVVGDVLTATQSEGNEVIVVLGAGYSVRSEGDVDAEEAAPAAKPAAKGKAKAEAPAPKGKAAPAKKGKAAPVEEEEEEEETSPEDMDEDELRAYVVEQGLASKKEAKGMDEDELRELLEGADEDDDEEEEEPAPKKGKAAAPAKGKAAPAPKGKKGKAVEEDEDEWED